ncbi:MAG: ParD-like family protein [Pseudomonadota bacterium]
MGIVKISDQMHENLRIASGALSRSMNAQAEHWLRIGLLAETNPDLRYSDICQLLLRAAQDGGVHLPGAANDAAGVNPAALAAAVQVLGGVHEQA